MLIFLVEVFGTYGCHLLVYCATTPTILCPPHILFLWTPFKQVITHITNIQKQIFTVSIVSQI